MSSFYTLFSVGLHPEKDKQVQVSWSEPYNSFTFGTLEVAASAPVYDMKVKPPRFLGVVFIGEFCIFRISFNFAVVESQILELMNLKDMDRSRT